MVRRLATPPRHDGEQGMSKLCPGDSTLTVAECVGGHDCGCQERLDAGCTCQFMHQPPWEIPDDNCPVHSPATAMLNATLKAAQ